MAVCLDCQTPNNSHLFDSPATEISGNKPLLGAKRYRCSQEADLAGSLAQKPCVWAEPPCLSLEREVDSRANLQSEPSQTQPVGRSPTSPKLMSGRLASPPGVERALSPGSAEVVSLRAAATAAVAECTGGLGIVGAGALAKSAADDTDSMASGQPGNSLQESQSLGLVTHNTQNLSIQDHAAAEAVSEKHQQSHQQEHTLDAFQACPPHGAKAICGRRPKMEDAYTAIPFLLEVPIPAGQFGMNELIPPRIATHVKTASSANSEHEGSETKGSIGDAAPVSPQGTYAPFMETLHFFGVFDGHGGAEAALHCAQTLHQRIAEALSAVSSPAAADKIKQSFAASQAETAAMLGKSASSQAMCKCPPDQECTCGVRKAQPHLSGSFSDAKLQALAEPKQIHEGDRKASDSDDSETSSAVNEAILEHRRESRQSGDQKAAPEKQQQQPAQTGDPIEETSSGSDASTATKIESALTNAFTRADEEFGKADNAALVGTTAVVALVGSRQLYVANCGDSRAVLSRGDVAIPLTDDHKAAREDETARVEAAGGQILFWNGVRVMGVLAVSRAIGDHCLRPFVIAQPEITILARKPDDELLLLASDGLWDVLTNQEACSLAKRCLRRARQRGATRQSAARIAATVLTRAAVDRGSRDNVTVVVVDLMSGPESEDLSRQPSSMVEGFENFNNDDISDPGYSGKSPRLSETSEVSQ